jgi:hypothetical protein
MAVSLQEIGNVRRQVRIVFHDQDGKNGAVAHARQGGNEMRMQAF